MQVTISVVIKLGGLEYADVQVYLYAGHINAQQDFVAAQTHPLDYRSSCDGTHLFEGTFSCTASGSYGYTLRVLPANSDLRSPLDMGLVYWDE